MIEQNPWVHDPRLAQIINLGAARARLFRTQISRVVSQDASRVPNSVIPPTEEEVDASKIRTPSKFRGFVTSPAGR